MNTQYKPGIPLELAEPERRHFTKQDLVFYVQSETQETKETDGAYFYVAESEDCPGYFNIVMDTPDNQTVRFIPNALEDVARDAVLELNAP